MTTAKDYLESALKLIEQTRLNVKEGYKATALVYLHDVKSEILAAARVLGIELEKDKQAK